MTPWVLLFYLGTPGTYLAYPDNVHPWKYETQQECEQARDGFGEKLAAANTDKVFWLACVPYPLWQTQQHPHYELSA